MSEFEGGSSVPRRGLGRELRRLRESARLNLQTAAAHAEVSVSTLQRIEGGRTQCKAMVATALGQLYGARQEQLGRLAELARETRTKGWWSPYQEMFSEGWNVYLGLESAASSLSSYEPELVPGLLQSEPYTRELIRLQLPDACDDEVERRVRLRSARQTLLLRPVAAPRVRFVLNEAVLRRPVGGADVMGDQIDRLIRATRLPNISIRVIPFTDGGHHGMVSGSFVLAEFPRGGNGDPLEPPTVYVDGYTGGLFLDKPAETQKYAEIFRTIWDNARDLTADTAREWT
jgi:DNA-binding XRE family transcriptional regulator